MAEEGAEITVLVPRRYCPDWLRRLLGKPLNYNHKLDLVHVEGLTAIPMPYFGLPGRWFNRWSGLSVSWALLSKSTALHQEKKFDVIYASELFLSGDSARRLARSSVFGGLSFDWKRRQPHRTASPTLSRHFRRLVTQLDGMLACGESIAEKIRDTGPIRKPSAYTVLSISIRFVR